MAKRWYVLHVYSGFENKVAEAIHEKARKQGLEDKIEEILVPMEEVVEVKRGQRVNAERKFFPGYVLAKLDMDDNVWHLIKDTPKVSGFLGAGYAQPTPEGVEAMHLARDLAGLKLETTYTAKALACLIADARSGRLAGAVPVFWQTWNSRPKPPGLQEVDIRRLPASLQKYLAASRPLPPA